MSDDVARVLTVGSIPDKYDKTYRVRGRNEDVFDVNPARLECSCEDFRTHRSQFDPHDARRVCEHLYGKLNDKSLSPIVSLFVRYGRTMYDCVLLQTTDITLVLGRSRGRATLRAVATIRDKPSVLTYDPDAGGWGSSLGWDEPDTPEIADLVLARLKEAFPASFAR
jgi:hypothetical protein